MGIPTRPCGTVEELKALGLNLALFPSCAPRDANKVEGCPMWSRCNCRDRDGHQIKGKHGPVNYGVRIAKPVIGRGVGRSQDVMPCYAYIQMRDQIKANKGICQIVAYEGDSIEVRGSKRIEADITAGRAAAWVNSTTMREVKPHPRPAEVPDLVDVSFLAMEVEREDAEEEAVTTARLIGSKTVGVVSAKPAK